MKQEADNRPTQEDAWPRRWVRRVAGLLRRGTGGEAHRQKLGPRAELEATRHLQQNGYKILERNFRATHGEVDLVVFKDGTVVFVEVRSRTEPAEPDPLYSVTGKKQKRVIRAAQSYVNRAGLWREDVQLRFDVVAIRYDQEGNLTGLQHIQDAFHT